MKSFVIRIKGDGTYKLRLSQDNRRASYSANFKSVNDEWVEVNIPIEDFIATWRGYTTFIRLSNGKNNSLDYKFQTSKKVSLSWKLIISKQSLNEKT